MGIFFFFFRSFPFSVSLHFSFFRFQHPTSIFYFVAHSCAFFLFLALFVTHSLLSFVLFGWKNISQAHPADSGNYSCVPSNAQAAHIAVHVLNNGGSPAAMQHGKRSTSEFVAGHSTCKSLSTPLLFIFIVTTLWMRRSLALR